MRSVDSISRCNELRRCSARRGIAAVEYALVISVVSIMVTIAAQRIQAAISQAAQRVQQATSGEVKLGAGTQIQTKKVEQNTTDVRGAKEY